MKKLGRAIKNARLDTGLEIIDLAKAANMHPETIASIELGKMVPRVDVLCIIAGKVHVNKDHLLALAGKVSPDVINMILKNAEKLCWAIRKLDKISDEDLGNVMAELRLMPTKEATP